MKNYTYTTMTIDAALDVRLPQVQDVRGKVWTSEQSAGLVKTVLDGGYMPPVVFARVPDGTMYNVDGQQRLFALRLGMEKGLLDGDNNIDVVVEDVEDEDGVIAVFNRLNSGVPVGKALIAASGMDAGCRSIIMDVAELPVIQNLFGATAQAKKTARPADVAMSLIAIAAGWDTPDSMAAHAATYLSTADKPLAVDADTVRATLIDIDAAYHRYSAAIAAMPKKDTSVSIAKSVCAAVRRKNNFLTIFHAALVNGVEPKRGMALFATPEKLEKGVVIEGTGPKGGKIKTPYHWTIGRGSSGSASEFRDRAVIMAALAPELTDEDLRMGLDPTGDAGAGDNKAVSADAVDAVAAAFGL